MTFKKHLKILLKKFTKSKLMETTISYLLFLYLKFTAITSRCEKKGVDEYFKYCEKNKSHILTAWHGRILLLPFSWNRKIKMNALVSIHRDGMIIANILKKFGVNIIGGSSTQNSKSAALSLMKKLNQNEPICIIPDGPRGPRMKLTMSPIYFAHKTGKPIFFATFNSTNKITFNSWDKMVLPLPFAKKAIVIVSEPYFIKKEATQKELEEHRQKLENIMNSINEEADKYIGDEPTKPGTKEKRTRTKSKKNK
jgi:lysophospholipid acyltransferase (LPLAT)-like uncharacterized protein